MKYTDLITLPYATSFLFVLSCSMAADELLTCWLISAEVEACKCVDKTGLIQISPILPILISQTHLSIESPVCDIRMVARKRIATKN